MVFKDWNAFKGSLRKFLKAHIGRLLETRIGRRLKTGFYVTGLVRFQAVLVKMKT